MIVVDIESTGTDSEKHALISIGAVDFLKPERTFYGECRVWSVEHVMDEALEVNGFELSSLTDTTKQSEAELITAFVDWAAEAENHTIAGHNPHFDLGFIQAAAHRNHIQFPFAHRVVDLHSICFAHMIWQGVKPPVEKQRTALSSNDVFRYTGIPEEPHPHNALNGAKWEAEAFARLLYKKNLLPEFADHPVPW